MKPKTKTEKKPDGRADNLVEYLHGSAKAYPLNSEEAQEALIALAREQGRLAAGGK